MWVAGVLVVLGIGAVAIAVVGWRPRATASPPLWDIPRLGGTYTQIVGTIAGFTVASAIFIAGLDVARGSPALATVMGMLLTAFLILVLTALVYASIPNAPASTGDAGTQALSHVLANVGGCLGLAISWLALVPLLQMIDLPALARSYTWLLLIVALAASGWTALFAYRLTPASARACLAMPVLAFALAALYRLGAARLWPALWPASDAALRFAFVAVGVAIVLFAMHAGLLLTHGEPTMRQRLERNGHRIALAASETGVLAAGLTWFAVAMP